jgi:hypothetical protein
MGGRRSLVRGLWAGKKAFSSREPVGFEPETPLIKRWRVANGINAVSNSKHRNLLMTDTCWTVHQVWSPWYAVTSIERRSSPVLK